jgi:hypothetical protein
MCPFGRGGSSPLQGIANRGSFANERYDALGSPLRNCTVFGLSSRLGCLWSLRSCEGLADQISDSYLT